MKKKILLGLLIVLVGIQFIHPARNHGEAETPQDITHAVQVPAEIGNVLSTSCYDCHSNHTAYPWYSYLNPVGWWLNGHIKDGKEELNFSEFATYDAERMDHKLEEIAEEVEEGHMPLPAYLWLHTDAKLSEAQIQSIVTWANTERQQFAGTATEQ
jgi:hypothetical protein